VLSDVDRLGRLGAFDDLVSYTPHRPAGEPVEPPLTEAEVYTRSTVGLYLTQAGPGSLDESGAERLRAVLRRFVPVNVRIVVRPTPPASLEQAHAAVAEVPDTFEDRPPGAAQPDRLPSDLTSPRWCIRQPPLR
jgi:hypothetical protein